MPTAVLSSLSGSARTPPPKISTASRRSWLITTCWRRIFQRSVSPIRELDDKPQKCRHQTCQGEHYLRFVGVRTGSCCRRSPALRHPAPSSRQNLFQRARGAKFKRSDGANARPDLAIIDDPQDDESAATPNRVKKNLNYLKKGIIPTAGHAKRIAVVVNATVIQKDDMVEKLLADSAWQGERIAMVQRWADAHDSFWMTTYAEERRRFDAGDPADQERARKRATKLYKANRAAADARLQRLVEALLRPRVRTLGHPACLQCAKSTMAPRSSRANTRISQLTRGRTRPF